ncbi:hypothetical protein EGR_03135 [Echinococcus granulosus]|uniref:Uncharacterized protein n=1 Tax=Echinococcus granulosus TaxID=6210 RepID=W6V6S4_ECHGR|nr:hypothetical protein EGR_03135 [Echinococcus granulosus]EUB62114.1 hypothetical protein EGR_03135 [Echinococcus granulosus]
MRHPTNGKEYSSAKEIASSGPLDELQLPTKEIVIEVGIPLRRSVEQPRQNQAPCQSMQRSFFRSFLLNTLKELQLPTQGSKA